MKINEGIQRLGWRFRESVKNKKPFKIMQGDADALNSLIEFYEKASKDNYNKNELMFKMYLWHRIEMMKYYKEDILGVQSQKTIAKALSKPVGVFLDRFTEFINDNDIKVLLKPISSNTKPYFLLNENEKNQGILKLQKLLKEKPDLFESAKWYKEDVQENLVAEFNQFLQIAG